MPGRGGLRVIAGSARGRILEGPPGRGTRPSSGRLREAAFSMLEAAGVDFASVLDLYAGTGALGIEALSRGAESCTFVEQDPRAGRVIRENLTRTGFGAAATVVVAHVGRWSPPPGSRYTLVLADPPYDDVAAWAAIERTVEGALDETGTLLVEHAARRAPPATLARRALWRDRRHGEGAIAIYRAGETRAEPTVARGEDA